MHLVRNKYLSTQKIRIHQLMHLIFLACNLAWWQDIGSRTLSQTRVTISNRHDLVILLVTWTCNLLHHIIWLLQHIFFNTLSCSNNLWKQWVLSWLGDTPHWYSPPCGMLQHIYPADIEKTYMSYWYHCKSWLLNLQNNTQNMIMTKLYPKMLSI